ncbi:farnesyl cysteine-carboxyl methyltransferase [Blastocladiella emersonii ATCC 22665]|nr:farnesyl cysteine-carboxyl methyltransferase [Blastocladiella emersonii ATCC 22665]
MSMKFRLLDGEHYPHNIAFYGFGIGAVFGAGALSIALVPQHAWLGGFLSALAIFHLTEYLVTAMYNYPKLELGSFLIPHSRSYVAATAAALTEYTVVSIWFPWIHASTSVWVHVAGLVLVAVGQLARSAAMIHASTNFSHQIEYRKRPNHELVTTGVYAWTRHPSYFGFYWWGIGSQLMLGNFVSTAVYAAVLTRFFLDRIDYEEELLVFFFGENYREYRAKTRVGIPFIR